MCNNTIEEMTGRKYISIARDICYDLRSRIGTVDSIDQIKDSGRNMRRAATSPEGLIDLVDIRSDRLVSWHAQLVNVEDAAYVSEALYGAGFFTFTEEEEIRSYIKHRSIQPR